MIARYSGRCTVCGLRIHKGAKIEWARGPGARHAACAVNARDHSSHEDRACGDTAYEDQCREACGL